MTGINGKSVEGIVLPSSGETLFKGLCASWNKDLVVKLLDQSSELGLSDDSQILVTYDGIVNERYLTGQKKTKTVQELKDNYFRWEDKEYYPKSKVLQNI